MANEKKIANRFGLNTKIYAYTDGTAGASELLNIDFANVTEASISGDSVWATGGQAHGNKIGFNNPMTGTLKISTQLMTNKLLSLMAGEKITAEGEIETIVFKNDSKATTPNYYTIVSETVWQAEDGTVLEETLTFHKAFPKRAFNITYDGSSDPVSVDVEFELAEDSKGQVLSTTRKAKSE